MSSPTRYSTSPAPWVPGALLYQAECLPILRSLPPASVAAVVTDPPYGLSDVGSAEVIQAITAWASGDRERVPNGKGFMGNEWDRFVPPPAVWDECFRVLKPGGHMAVFAGSRTADLMGLSIRLAGFEMRDTITWMYGSGFPKSLDIGKALDKAAEETRQQIERIRPDGKSPGRVVSGFEGRYAMNAGLRAGNPICGKAKQWDGWGTALKPAGEPIIVARKPLAGTVAQNVLTHSTGGMNIDGCRVPAPDAPDTAVISLGAQGRYTGGTYNNGLVSTAEPRSTSATSAGRWPANVVLSHTEWCDEGYCEDGCPIAELDAQSGDRPGNSNKQLLSLHGKTDAIYGVYSQRSTGGLGRNDFGGASRFFNTFHYQAKAPKSERPVVNGVAHPTVKPLALMEWLVTLFTPPYGVVLDPFAGSGTTGHAALKLGFNSIMVERAAKYKPLIDKRLNDYLAALVAKTPA